MRSTNFSSNLGKVALGSLATILAAGPCTAILLLGFLTLHHGSAGDASGFWAVSGNEPTKTLATLTIGASLTGLIGSLPATILNTAIQENFVRGHWDSWVVGAIAGAISGAIVIGTLLQIVISLTGPEMVVATSVTSILMGLLYWSIAIRPRRNIRLAGVRSKIP